MGFKQKIIASIVLIVLLIGAFLYALQPNEDYSNKIMSILSKQEKTMVQDIFSFEFDRAYIFNDCYISGNGLNQRYDVGLSIAQVETGVSENIQRIVFVNESGSFVYEFQCDSNEILLLEKGIVIYPETVIERESLDSENPFILKFNSSERYDL